VAIQIISERGTTLPRQAHGKPKQSFQSDNHAILALEVKNPIYSALNPYPIQTTRPDQQQRPI
jgi:hypothetical protein